MVQHEIQRTLLTITITIMKIAIQMMIIIINNNNHHHSNKNSKKDKIIIIIMNNNKNNDNKYASKMSEAHTRNIKSNLCFLCFS